VALIREIRRGATHLTREYWIGLWRDNGADELLMLHAEQGWASQYAGSTGTYFDPAIPAEDLERLTSEAAHVKEWVDEHVAHTAHQLAPERAGTPAHAKPFVRQPRAKAGAHPRPHHPRRRSRIRLRPVVAGRPGALLRLAPLRTGRATFTASGSGKPSWSVDVTSYDPLNLGRVVRGSVHHDRGRGV
jgi:hypothetical protein